MEMKETKQKNNKLIKIMIIILAVIIISIIGFVFLNNGPDKEQVEQRINELKEQEIILSAAENKAFLTGGFSEEYYRIQSELNGVKKELAELDMYSNASYVFIPIIMFSLIAFGIIFVIFSNVISGFRRTHDTFDLVHDVIRTRIKEQELRNTKIEAIECPNCKANLKPGATKCEYCRTHVQRVQK